MIIEPATHADLDAIDEIEQHSFATPWPRSVFEGELTRAWARVDIVRMRPAGPIVAFANYWLVAGEVHILAISTHPDHRRQGVGARLLGHALDQGRAIGATLATLEVRKGNRPAIALYERAGFATVHVRAGYYQDNQEDALVMLADLTGTPR